MGQLEKERKALGLDNKQFAEKDRNREAKARKETEKRVKAHQIEKHAQGLRKDFLRGIEQDPRVCLYWFDR